MQVSIPGLSPSFPPYPLCLAGLCSLLSVSQPCSHHVPCLERELLLRAPPLQQLLLNRGNCSGQTHTPQRAGDGPRLLAALPKRAKPPAPHTGLARSPAQLVRG